MNTTRQRALYDNLKQYVGTGTHENPASYNGIIPEDATASLATAVDHAIRNVKKADWRGNRLKEREVRIAIKSVIGNDEAQVSAIFDMVRNRHHDY